MWAAFEASEGRPLWAILSHTPTPTPIDRFVRFLLSAANPQSHVLIEGFRPDRTSHRAASRARVNEDRSVHARLMPGLIGHPYCLGL